MDLKEFVAEAITAVLEGVAEAQKGEHGNRIGPTFRFQMSPDKEMLGVIAHGSNNYTVLQFDVAVTSSTTGTGGARIKVLEVVSAGGEGTASREVASRVKFSVPIKLPQVPGT